jgi:co-chaperonin GroES (HSP10)
LKRGLTPVGELVYVQRMKDEEADGLEIIDLQGKRRFCCRGRVLAVGPGSPVPGGGFIKPDLKKGDLVFFAASTGIDTNYPGLPNLVVMRASDIIAVAIPGDELAAEGGVAVAE